MKMLGYVVIGLGVGGLAYLNYTKNPMFESLKSRILPGSKGNYRIEDFYKTSDRGIADKTVSALRRRSLSAEAWENEKINYAALQKALANKVDSLNSMSQQDSTFGDGKLVKEQINAIVEELNELEDKYTQEALLGDEVRGIDGEPTDNSCATAENTEVVKDGN